MFKFLITLLLVLISYAEVAVADDLKDGEIAYNKKDYVTAFKKFQSSANSGNTRAQIFLAMMYEEGEGVPKNSIEAIRLLTLAGNKGEDSAQLFLGIRYRDGLSVTQSYSQAMYWFKLVADKGNKFAQNDVGVLYEKGMGVSQDYLEALHWYNLSAEQGYFKPQINIAQIYLKTDVIGKDKSNAYMWLYMASKTGDKNASEILDSLALSLDSNQIKHSIYLANKCIENNFKKCDEKIDNLLLSHKNINKQDSQSKLSQINNKLPEERSPSCSGNDARRWTNCQGVHNFTNGDRYEGEFRNGKLNGWGTYYHLANNQFRGDKYTGQFVNDTRQGSGRYIPASGGEALEGTWNAGVLVKAEKVNLQTPTDFALVQERKRIEDEKMRLTEERRLMDEEKKRREIAKSSTKMDLKVTTTEPDANGLVVISIQTGVDTSSLKVNGEEQGGQEKGFYQIKRLPKVGQDTTYNIAASDGYGNIANKSIVVKAQSVAVSKVVTTLNPETLRKSPTRDAVAIIVGIQDYKRLPKADFANDDARSFYDYAVRALGIKPENIKMLIDGEAEQVEILSAFKSWLPSYVNKGKTDVYVFYSGHGLPSTDGKSLFFLPQNGHKDYLPETGIDQNSLVSAITATKPKSVTLFIDSCYSGSTRSGETLLASARPIALKANESIFPSNFTVISASSLDQISSSSPELKHGIFSFYVMKGLEGAADLNGDGKITAGELQTYLADVVPRQAMKMNRKQEPQLVGDAERVLVVR